MILTDTGYFIALVNPRDVLHPRAAFWSLHCDESYLVTEYVLLEFVNYFSKSIHRPKVHRLLDEIRSSHEFEVISATTSLFDAGLRLHAQRPDKNWSLTDCISFLVMNERGITKALAHDEHFEQTGFDALLRREPTTD